MYSRLLQYLKYRLRARTLHGTHSPFVYEFAERVLYNEHQLYAYSLVENLRAQLLRDSSSIEIEDHGAGSRISGKSRRTIKSIAMQASSNKKYGQLLHRISWFYRPKRILELGTNLGLGTAYLAMGSPKAKVTTIEGDPELVLISRKNMESLGLESVEVVQGIFSEVLPRYGDGTFNLIFIDGHHDREATIEYFNLLIDSLEDGGVIIFDDINWSSGMASAWEDIIPNPKIQVSIDLFRMGLVWKRPGQKKEHFVLRF